MGSEVQDRMGGPWGQKCDCLERLNLKIESELDRLRGLFRMKEMDLFHP